LDATGAGGFEGLVATALAALTGLTFRLAQSGLQFGRDASTPRGRFAVAMEAKRYADPMTLEDLVGKAAVAAHHLRGDIDLWVLCVTSEVGEATLRGLEATLEDSGISLLALDWSERPLPRLAVLLAAKADAVIDWFRDHAPGVDAKQLKAALEAVVHHPGFAQEVARLVDDATGHLVGLGPLSEANRAWIGACFADRLLSRRSFGQFVTIADPERPAVARPSVEPALNVNQRGKRPPLEG
jgi:hypothetical protein